MSFLSNSALLSEIVSYELSFYSAFLWNDIKEEFAAFAGRTSYFNYGFSISYLNYEKIEGRDIFGFKRESFTPYDFAFHLGFARAFSKFLNVGIVFGFAYEKIERKIGSSFLISFGTKYTLPRNPSFKFGFSLLNLGTKVKFEKEYFPIPFIFKAGLFYKKLKAPYFVSGEFSLPFDDIPYFSVGLAYSIREIFELRGGFKTSFDAGFVSAFRFGFGLKFSKLYLDYAFIPHGVVGFTHHIDLKFKF